jgi:hypothetical protein
MSSKCNIKWHKKRRFRLLKKILFDELWILRNRDFDEPTRC